MASEETNVLLSRKRSFADYEGAQIDKRVKVDPHAQEQGYINLLPLSFFADIAPDSSSDDGLGPALPSTAQRKKRRKLPHEKLYVDALPDCPRYSKSLMHKDQLSFVTISPATDFLITSSLDGVIKFWKKIAVGIESVKEFRAHSGEIRDISVSQDGRSFASAGTDKTIKIFDIITFGTSLGIEIRATC